VTGRLVAIGRHVNLLVMIPNEREGGRVTPVTIHATTRQQINARLKSGRLLQNEFRENIERNDHTSVEVNLPLDGPSPFHPAVSEFASYHIMAVRNCFYTGSRLLFRHIGAGQRCSGFRGFPCVGDAIQ
jgi:hypothetical protein